MLLRCVVVMLCYCFGGGGAATFGAKSDNIFWPNFVVTSGVFARVLRFAVVLGFAALALLGSGRWLGLLWPTGRRFSLMVQGFSLIIQGCFL